jgi:hypothetical protein
MAWCKVPLAEVQTAESEISLGQAEGVIARLGQPHRFFSPRGALVECPQIGQTRDQPIPGHYSGEAGHAEALTGQLTREGGDIPAEAVDRPTIVA